MLSATLSRHRSAGVAFAGLTINDERIRTRRHGGGGPFESGGDGAVQRPCADSSMQFLRKGHYKSTAWKISDGTLPSRFFASPEGTCTPIEPFGRRWPLRASCPVSCRRQKKKAQSRGREMNTEASSAGDAGGITPTLGPAVAVSAGKSAPKELRYHAHISKFAGCPPGKPAVQEIGYRFCFSNLDDPRNFQPNAMLDLARADGRAPPSCCSSYALSMFVDLQSLIAKGQKIQKTVKKFFEKKGNHFAKLDLCADHGRCTEANSDGHFDFFEYTTFTAKAAVVEHAKLDV